MSEQPNERAAPYVRIFCCGTFRVEVLRDPDTMTYHTVTTAQWGGSSYPRVLLKALLCCPGRRARREILREMLWPQHPLKQATQCLNTGVTKLRSVLRWRGQRSFLITEERATSVRLEEQPLVWVDADAALLLLKDAEHLGRTTRQAISLLEEAAGYLERGAFLEREEWNWIDKPRKQIAEAWYRCQIWLSEAYEQHGMPGQAEAILSTLLAEEPTDEDILRRLLLFLHQQKMTHRARRRYEETKHRLLASGQPLSLAIRLFAEELLYDGQTSTAWGGRRTSLQLFDDDHREE